MEGVVEGDPAGITTKVKGEEEEGLIVEEGANTLA